MPLTLTEALDIGIATATQLAAKAIVRKPVAVRVEKLYEKGSFVGLGMGT